VIVASESGYLKPKVGSPTMLRSERNGQFVNQPLWLRWGGFKNSFGLHRGTERNMALEKGGPQAKANKPI
jgi:hypothetical protein